MSSLVSRTGPRKVTRAKVPARGRCRRVECPVMGLLLVM